MRKSISTDGHGLKHGIWHNEVVAGSHGVPRLTGVLEYWEIGILRRQVCTPGTGWAQSSPGPSFVNKEPGALKP